MSLKLPYLNMFVEVQLNSFYHRWHYEVEDAKLCNAKGILKASCLHQQYLCITPILRKYHITFKCLTQLYRIRNM